LEEFLRRRARLQRVEEEVRRRIVLGFFDTLYWSRRFKRHMDIKRSGRMTAIPQLDVPEIFVDDEDDRAMRAANSSGMGGDSAQTPMTPGYLSAMDATAGQHPLSGPRMSMGGNHGGRNHRAHTSAFSFELHEPMDGTGTGSFTADGSSDTDRRENPGSGTPVVSPAQVREMLDDSVWMDSIRRSATIRRSEWDRGGPYQQGWS
jgi:hypothetical protein